MPKVTIPELVIRTTADNPGCVHGLAVGAGPGIDAALLSLGREGRTHAQEILARVLEENPGQQADAVWQFEIIDVRLVRGHRGDPGEAWVAVGTLCSHGGSPWSGSFWDNPRAALAGLRPAGPARHDAAVPAANQDV